MGSYRNINIGPYMIVTGTKEVEEDKSINTCSNSTCEKHIKNKEMTSAFCSTCGSVVNKKEYKEKEQVYPSEILYNIEEFIDELCETSRDCSTTNRQVFIANEKSPFDSKDRKFDSGDYFDLNLMNVNHTEEIEWFKNRFEKIILLLENELGKGSIEFRWGIIQWYN